MSKIDLFSTAQVGSLTLKNRMVMAPLTRNRAGDTHVPNALMADYYTQRASAGLIITEATQVTPEGIGYPGTPGIHSHEQVAGWKLTTDAVHQAGGKIFLQLWHVGRISHSLFQPNENLPVSSSAVKPQGQIYTPQGMKDYETPRPLEIDEIQDLIFTYKYAAENAKEAGFDGVEIHAANGYLIDQFLRDGVNKRTDAYGGSEENRARFLLEVTEAVVEAWGKERVGVRLSPSNTFNDMSDSNPVKTFSYAVKKLDEMGIAYVHLIEGSIADIRHGGEKIPTEIFRPLFHQTLIVNNGYDQARATEALQNGDADLIAFGVPFLANPDLPNRFKVGAALNKPDQKTFYGGGAEGYTDYPFLS